MSEQSARPAASQPILVAIGALSVAALPFVGNLYVLVPAAISAILLLAIGHEQRSAVGLAVVGLAFLVPAFQLMTSGGQTTYTINEVLLGFGIFCMVVGGVRLGWVRWLRGLRR
jgi:hypothetical protein